MEGRTFIKIALFLSLQATNSNFSERFLHNFNENGVLTLSLTFHVFVVRTFAHFSPNNLWQHRRLNLQRHQILQFPTNLQNCKNIKMPKVVRAEECCHILLSCYKILSSTILRTTFGHGGDLNAIHVVLALIVVTAINLGYTLGTKKRKLKLHILNRPALPLLVSRYRTL